MQDVSRHAYTLPQKRLLYLGSYHTPQFPSQVTVPEEEPERGDSCPPTCSALQAAFVMDRWKTLKTRSTPGDVRQESMWVNKVGWMTTEEANGLSGQLLQLIKLPGEGEGGAADTKHVKECVLLMATFRHVTAFNSSITGLNYSVRQVSSHWGTRNGHRHSTLALLVSWCDSCDRWWAVRGSSTPCSTTPS
jgi:hypothetical protein